VSARAPQAAGFGLRLLTGLLLAAVALPALAQYREYADYAKQDLADWKEDAVPPPPSYSTSRLIEIEMPRTSSVRMGIDPKTIRINQDTGIVRYVVVARGPSAVNASYEGMRCATAEYRVYARQVQGSAWLPAGDGEWKDMRAQSGAQLSYPYNLARGGMCHGVSVPLSVADMVNDLEGENPSMYAR